MDAHFSERIVSKIEAAKIQLDAAIRAYHQNEDIVAITLAGASEEILGKICKARGIENAVEKIAKLEPLCQKFDSQNKCIDHYNDVRNNLKHAGDGIDKDFVIADLDAFFMIARALGNAGLLGIVDTEMMARFRNNEFIKEIKGE